MLEVRNLVKIFKGELLEKDKKVLDSLSFRLAPGKITGFLGHNGSGKTTTIKIAMGFTSVTSGEVIFDKALGKNREEIFRNIGYLPERPYFYPHLTGREFLQYMVELTGKDWKRAQSLITEFGERLAIIHALNRKLSGYSKGMLQRVGFLSNIICEASLVILDEPLSGLDPVGRKQYKEIIKEINKKGATVFFSSHIVHDVEEVSTDLVIIEHGKLVYNGEIEKLYQQGEEKEFKIKFLQDGHVEFVKSTEEQLENKITEIKNKGWSIYEISRDNKSLEEIVYHLNE